MKNRQIFFLIMIGLPLLGCQGRSQSQDYETLFEYNLVQWNKFLSEYPEGSRDFSFIDSALFYLNRNEELIRSQKVNKPIVSVLFSKILMYSIKNDFINCNKTLTELKNVKDLQLLQPEWIEMMSNKLKIQEEKYYGRTDGLRPYYEAIFKIQEKKFEKYKPQVDSVWFLNDPRNTPYYYPLILEYYYYKSKIYGKEKVLAEMDSIQTEQTDKDMLMDIKSTIQTDKNDPVFFIY